MSAVERPRAPGAPRPPRRRPAGSPAARGPVLLAVGVVALGAVLFLLGTLPRLFRHAKISGAAAQVRTALPVVSFVQPTQVSENGVVLPGNIQGGRQTTIQARTSGYVAKVYADIGSRVKA